MTRGGGASIDVDGGTQIVSSEFRVMCVDVLLNHPGLISLFIHIFLEESSDNATSICTIDVFPALKQDINDTTS